MEAIGVQEVLALLVALDAALGAAHALARDAPQQPLALVAVGRRGGRPHLEVVRRGAGDGVDEGLQGLLVHVALLPRRKSRRGHRVDGKRTAFIQCFFFNRWPLKALHNYCLTFTQ